MRTCTLNRKCTKCTAAVGPLEPGVWKAQAPSVCANQASTAFLSHQYTRSHTQGGTGLGHGQQRCPARHAQPGPGAKSQQCTTTPRHQWWCTESWCPSTPSCLSCTSCPCACCVGSSATAPGASSARPSERSTACSQPRSRPGRQTQMQAGRQGCTRMWIPRSAAQRWRKHAWPWQQHARLRIARESEILLNRNLHLHAGCHAVHCLAQAWHGIAAAPCSSTRSAPPPARG